MRRKNSFKGRPYRATAALGEGRWSIYGEDDEGQERYLGTIVQQKGSYNAIMAYSNEVVQKQADSFEDAVEALYEECVASGYLVQGHSNYLGNDRSGR